MRSAMRASVLLLLLAGCRPGDPFSAFQRGELQEAADGYQALLTRGDASPLVHYNLGSVLLRMQQFEASRPHLERGARSAVDSVRARAYYNLGNSYLEPVFAGAADPARGDHLGRAIVAYKRALLLVPGDPDAKWNLELARRLLLEPPPAPRPNPRAGGGTGGGGGGGSSGQDNPEPQRGGGGGSSPTLSQTEAEQILAAAEQRELGVQRAKLRKAQPPSPTAH